MGQYFPQIEALEKQMQRELPAFRVGDNVRVHYRITEGDKERIQVFQGTVIRKSGGGIGRTFSVRKRSAGVGVERVFPYHSPRIEKLEIVSHGRVRRARLYFLRELQGKAARLKGVGGHEAAESTGTTQPPPAAEGES
jgi:large subunit ribosomal protein L19